MKCEYEGHICECFGEVSLHHAMTKYVFDGIKNSPEDPNKDFFACDDHWEEYRTHWQEMWDIYYGEVL